MIRLAPLALALALLPACDKPVTYSYFLIEAKLDPTTVDFELINRITACAVLAQTPAREDSADLPCKRHQVVHNLGTFEYTTTLTSGAIKFVLIANDSNQMLLARGETTPLDIVPGKTVTATVVATALPAPEPDAGAPATPDSSTPEPDAGTTPGPDGGTTD
jgi:hypothetical protein